MAYVSKPLPKEEENKFGLTSPTTPSPLPPQAGGSAGSGLSGGGSKAAPGFASSTQFGSNAAKLSDYLNANKDQVDAYGNKIAGDLSKGYSDTTGAIDQGFNAFNSSVNQGYAQPDEDLINGAISNSAEFVKNPGNVSKFQSLFNDQYKGPDSFETSDSYGGLNDKVNKAVENANLLKSQGGLNTFLNTGNKENLTAGGQALNTALLQKSPEAATAIRNAASPYENLSSYLGDKTTQANQNVANAKKTASDTSANLQNQFLGEKGILPSFQTDINNRVQQSRTQATDRNKAVIDALTNGDYGLFGGANKISPQVVSDLGASSPLDVALVNYAQGPWNLNPMSFLTSQNPEAQINSNNVSTQDDYTRAAALAQLTGQPSFLDPMNASQAGTANLDLSDFNSDAFNQAKQLAYSGATPEEREANYKQLLNRLMGVNPPPPITNPGPPPPPPTGGTYRGF